MGVAATPKLSESDYFTHREMHELEISDQQCFNHHALFFGYNVTHDIHNAMQVATWVGGLLPGKVVALHPLQGWKMHLSKQGHNFNIS